MRILGDNFFQSVEYMNDNCRKIIADYIWKVLDESVFDYFPQTTNNGGLLKISCIERKPWQLETYFKYVLCDKTEILPRLEIQRVKFNKVPFFTVTLMPPLIYPFILISFQEVVARLVVHRNSMPILPPQVTSSRGDPDLLPFLPASIWWRRFIAKEIVNTNHSFFFKDFWRKPQITGRMVLILSWSILSMLLSCMMSDTNIHPKQISILFLLTAATQNLPVNPTSIDRWICT